MVSRFAGVFPLSQQRINRLHSSFLCPPSPQRINRSHSSCMSTLSPQRINRLHSSSLCKPSPQRINRSHSSCMSILSPQRINRSHSQSLHVYLHSFWPKRQLLFELGDYVVEAECSGVLLLWLQARCLCRCVGCRCEASAEEDRQAPHQTAACGRQEQSDVGLASCSVGDHKWRRSGGCFRSGDRRRFSHRLIFACWSRRYSRRDIF